MTIIEPEATPVLGNVKVKAVLTVADRTAPKLATEINHATSVELTCALIAGGWTPSGAQGKGQRQRRLCRKSSAETLNAVQWTIGALQYSLGSPQAPNTDIQSMMAEGAKVNIVERLGLDAEDDPFTVGEKTRTHYLQLGEPIAVYDTNDENAEFLVMQEVVYVSGSGPVNGVIVA